MLILKDEIFISLKIDGDEVDYASLKDITLCEGNGVMCPTLKLELDDPYSTLSTNKALSEGNKIDLLIAKSAKDRKSTYRKFRIFGPGRANNAFNPSLTIVCLLDAPKFYTKAATESYSGTTEEVCKQVAAKSGLKFSGPSSFNGRTMNDKQNQWLSVCKNRATFIAETIRHGWLDEHSGMAATVTAYGELRYRNMLDVINTKADKIQYVFSHNARYNTQEDTKRVYVVKQAVDSSTAGVMATTMNYGSTRVINCLDGKPRQIKALDVKTPGAYLALNKEVSDMVERARFDYAPIDCGNTHKKFQDALYQNIKILGLFTEKMSLLVTEVTEVQLYDPVIYRQADCDLNAPVRNTDIYLVIGKTTVLRSGMHYAERIELARMSLTMKGTTELQAPSGTPSERSMLPEVSIDQASIGNQLDSLPEVRGISDTMGSISDVVAMLDSMPEEATQLLQQTLGPAQEFVQALHSGFGVPDAITNLLAPAAGLVSQLSTISGLANRVAPMATSLVSQVASMPQAMRMAVIAGPTSLLSAATQQLSALTQLSRANNFLAGAVRSVPQEHAALPQSIELTNAANASNVGVQQCSVTAADQWNTSVASMTGYAQPTTPPESSLITRLDTMLQSGATDTVIKTFLETESVKDTARSGNWIRASDVYSQPATDVEGTLVPLENIANRVA